jgi:hypothetical protein
VDGVREQRDAAGQHHHDRLHQRGGNQRDERPLQGPYPTFGGGYRRVYCAVGVVVNLPMLVLFAMVICHDDITVIPGNP